MKKAAPSPEELAAFHASVQGSVPLRPPDRVMFAPPKPAPRPRQREQDEAAAVIESLYAPLGVDDLLALGDTVSYLRPGMGRSVLRDLRRGRWAIQNHTDLHGLNRHEAHVEINRFLAESHNAGKRCVRIVHGRGYGSPGREGILRPLVKSWLIRRQDILAFCQAPFYDGGEGVLWVLLQASSKKQESEQMR